MKERTDGTVQFQQGRNYFRIVLNLDKESLS